MKTNLTFSGLLAMAFMLLTINFTFAQNVITVDNNSTNAANYTSFQDAINAANNGDIIYVQHSNASYGNINVTKPLTVIGRSWYETNYITYVATLNIQSSNVVIKGLHIQNGLNIQAASNTPISNIQVKECRSGLVTIGANYPVSNVVLQGNHFEDRIHQYTNATNVMVMNNFISGEIRSYQPQTFLFTQNIVYAGALYNYGDANGIFQVSNSMFFGGYWQGGNIPTYGRYKAQNCLTWNDYYGTYDFAGSENPANTVENCILSTNPQLEEYLEITGLQLANGSPAIGAGFGGEDLGVYHNYAFSPLGNPIGYPTLTIDSAPSSVPAGGDLNVTVTAEAH